MSEETTELATTEERPPLTQQEADDVSWVIAKIAESDFVIGPPGTFWAGQKEITDLVIAQCDQMGRPGLSQNEAEKIVALTSRCLWEGVEPNRNVARTTMIARLVGLKRVLANLLAKGEYVEVTYMAEKKTDREGNLILSEDGSPIMLKVPIKWKHKPIDMVACINQHRAIEHDLAELQGLIGSQGTGADAINQMFRQLEKIADKQTKDKKKIDTSKFGQAGMQKIIDAAASLHDSGGKKVKAIKATVTTTKHDDDNS